ncbi:MAG: glucuronate isomerase [Eggerthellaceae bacterium]|nr:glucuronate isomerase [Eggerthellaceae bacterium]
MSAKAFMDNDFILQTDTAKYLFHNYAENLPLIDYHCHISPKEIFENRKFKDITEVWLGGHLTDGSYFGDHYKWRVMRSNGTPEEYVTGDKSAYERFCKFVEALQLCIGNPMYHWCHMELRKYFGCDLILKSENAKAIWDITKEKLENDTSLTVRGLIKSSKVEFIGTTDDPIDSLEWHKKLADDPSFDVQVCPSFRADRALNIDDPGFLEYLDMLAQAAEMPAIKSVEDVCKALVKRLDFFGDLGCRASDHAFINVPFKLCSEKDCNAILKRALVGEEISASEREIYQTYVMLRLGKEYAARDIAMQIHYSCARNVNSKKHEELRADVGFDVISPNDCGLNIHKLLNELDSEVALPKTILYSLNPIDNELIDSILGAFQTSEIPGKVQHGSAWWFNDTKSGIEAQMISLANLSILGNFVGMLTDSRSFLSYARHDYFRRILCNLLGNWVENGEYPDDNALLKKIVEGISYANAKRF